MSVQVIYRAEHSSFPEFLERYSPEMVDAVSITGENALFGAVRNRDINARVAIAGFLLGQGIDATAVIRGNLNVLHVLFGRKGHDAELEAPMLAGLIKAGADINLVAKRVGPPLMGLIDKGGRDADRGPFYDVVFSVPDLKFDIPAGPATSMTLRKVIMGEGARKMPLMKEYLLAYEAERGET